ncbi:ABC transporter ATP-binding protein [uncultured Ilyobacter sp.]|uniref:ABC transporter ATP-binding protein n=1 Tax=uncultured Ilyobacter sp. TaxID=544433 RepID=UPI0029C7EB3F|nr:ABC transporter ATP-binding protein [uncultured Ilyobacter sp.]
MIRVENLCKKYGSKIVMDNFNINFEKNKVSVLLGPSGCGKSTLFNILSSLDKEYRGKVGIDGKVSYIFQEDRLIPWLTVEENLKLIHSHGKIIDDVLERFHVDSKARTLARNLSGGEKQRVSIARAFYHGGETILMDEALRSLDMLLKLKIIEEMSDNISRESKTMVIISHDIQEALLIGDRIFILDMEPMRIVHSYDVETPRKNRILKSGELLDLEKEIYEKLLGKKNKMLPK